MTTIREVAKKAGVSLTTVSHVINETRFVSETTRKRVLTAMEELNFRPNALAQSLRSGKTHILGLVQPDSSNPYFAEIVRAIEDEAFRRGYSVILCNTEGDAYRERFYVEVLYKKQVDGVIFVAAGDLVDSLTFLQEQKVPVIVIGRDFPGIEVDAVLTDNQQGGYLATRHLIELGHRRIACVSGPSNLTTPSADRVTGYKKALEESGIPVDPELIRCGNYHPDSGFQAAQELFALPSPPSAIFACNDLMAFGVLYAAEKANQSISVVGFDNIELAQYSNPSLTTIAQPKVDIGVYAACSLVERIQDKQLPRVRRVLSPELIIRESTRPASQ